MSAFTVDSRAKKVSSVNPRVIRAKYSGGPKRSVTRARNGARNVRAITLSVPAMNEPNAAMPSAAPARPWRAMT